MWRHAVRSSRSYLRPLRPRLFFSTRAPAGRMSMKDLAKNYGWTATGVYCALMAIDLPLFYALVHSLGENTITDYEVAIRKWLGVNSERDETYAAKAAHSGKGLFYAELGIAYILHKIFIVVRVPLTVAITPKVAVKLQQWGFNVAKAVPTVDKAKLAQNVSQAAGSKKKGAQPVNEAFKNPGDKVNVAEKNRFSDDGVKKEISDRFGHPPSKKGRFFSGLL